MEDTRGQNWSEGPYEQILLFGDSLTQGSARNKWTKKAASDVKKTSSQKKTADEQETDDQGTYVYDGGCEPGDRSYGFCFAAALQNLYTRQFDVIIRGFNGYNTNQAVAIFPQFLPKPTQARIRLITVFFGANDSMLPGVEHSQYVDLSQYKRNLARIIHDAGLAMHRPHILLITPPPVNEEQLEGKAQGSRKATKTKKYVDACKELAQEDGKNCAEVVDLWKAIMDDVGWDESGWEGGEHPLPGSMGHPLSGELREYFTDGLHFNGKGYEMLFKATLAKIKATWGDMNLDEDSKQSATDKGNWKYPLWNGPGWDKVKIVDRSQKRRASISG